MTIKEWKKVARILKEAYKEVESEAISAGVDIFSDEYKAGLEKVREKILEKLGFTVDEYKEMYEEFTQARKKDVDKKIAEVSERIDNLPELPEVPTKEQIKELAEEVAEEVVKRNLKPQYTGSKVLTDGSATGIVDIAVATGEFLGGSIEYSIYVTDGTDYQAHSGSVFFNAVNKAGTVSSDIEETYLAASESEVATAGTLTDVWSVTNGTGKITINVNADTSLTPSANYPVIKYTIKLHSQNSITPL